jgi:nucleotide-binding universal stress UspA family protein
MYERILVPLDGSARAEEVLPSVVELAKKFNSEIVLLQAVTREGEAVGEFAVVSDTPVIGPSTADVAQMVSPAIEERARQQSESMVGSAHDYLEKRADDLQKLGIKVRTEVKEGRAAQVVLDYAKSGDVGLIAMSTHGRGGLRRLVFGSVADEVLKNAHLPVLLIRSSL